MMMMMMMMLAVIIKLLSVHLRIDRHHVRVRGPEAGNEMHAISLFTITDSAFVLYIITLENNSTHD